ncbi:DUF6945 domain-containing protein [Stutzerimonas frequens]|uniref:DUF6945 domain-containing protein n=1 Tax=Stutzerimonas frequens TaxID=2968969 RepID=UPI001909AF0B|nr:hypothetical protein [Stutzerimonas frequens]MBK3872110.1 hypothetical protein [Stutzerimonas frequens]MBK3910641.1 hypothetical protein [Stutzerimonas frequens]MBK3929902.1 hypothetical protein [Stutzerimonas frequens]
MATQLFAKSEQQLDIYLPAYKNILSAKGWVDLVTGETKVFSAEQKLVWLYVLDRYKFFTDDKRAYFDNQIDIGNACGVSERTVLRFFKELKAAGYLQINQTRIGGHKSNSYVISRDLVLVQKDEKDATAKPAQAPQELAAPQMDDFVPAGAEWASEAVPMDVYEDFVQELEDDGSCDDAFSYSEQETIQEHVSILVQEKEPVTIHGVSLADMPSKRFQPNGDVSKEMAEWCARNNIKIFEAEYDVQFLFKGIPHVFNNNTFVPCSSQPARKQLVEEFQAPF